MAPCLGASRALPVAGLDEVAAAVSDLTAGSYQAGDAVDPSAIYDQLARHLVARDETLELTALVAAGGLVLLIGATVLSLARTGRLP